MSTIPVSTIVGVSPGVLNAGGSALVLNGLCLTTNSRIPIGAVQSFPTQLAVASYFGAGSTEAAAASTYFAGFDDASLKPGAMFFTQYPSTAVGAYLRGGNISTLSVAQLQALGTGTLNVTVDGYVRAAASINLSGAASFSAAAALIQTGLNSAPVTQATITAAIAATTLTVSAIPSGTLSPGQLLVGAGITANTQILAQLTGTTGGIGTYQVSISQSVASESMTTTGVPVVANYDSVSGAFVISSGITGAPSLSGYATGTLSSGLLLTSAAGAVTSQGSAAAAPGTFMDGVIRTTQNWATFFTLQDPDVTGNANKLAFAAWASSKNNNFGYICWDTDATPGISVPATTSLGYLLTQASYSGTCLISAPTYAPAAFVSGSAASLNFSQANGRSTFAFMTQASLAPTVTDPTVAANLIANGYNYYGAYATANQGFQFFYPGSVSGAFLWMDSFINEIWLTNQFQLALMNLLLQVNSIPYNSTGYGLIEAACQSVINAALNFGAIRTGVVLSSAQAAAVNNAAGAVIDGTLSTRGWYLQVLPASSTIRQARTSPVCNFWYTDGQSVQKIQLNSIEIQ